MCSVEAESDLPCIALCKGLKLCCALYCAKVYYRALHCVQGSTTVQGSFPGSLPSQPRSPFALHSFYWAVTPFVTIIIKIIIKIFITVITVITTLEKDNEPTSLGRLPPLSASPRLNSNPCFLHLIIIWPLASSSSHQQHQHELLTETNYYRASAF